MKQPLLIALFAAGFFACAPCESHAQCRAPGFFAGGLYGQFYGLPAMWQTSYNGRTPPYFAIHPPVYYSGQINRIPYGASPFAADCMGYPSAAMHTAAMPAASSTPTMVVNPHYQAGEKKAASLPSSAIEAGIMIVNPYYQPTRFAAK